MAALCGALVVSAAGVGGTNAAAKQARVATPASATMPGLFTATITVNTSAKAVGGITNHFAGLSFESRTLNSGDFVDSGNLPQLLRNLGTSIMRFGGNTVDDGSFPGISPSALIGLAGLARASGWTVLYSEDLGHYDAAAVTADASQVATALGPRLAAIACGNEPDAYGGNGDRPSPYTVAEYLKDAAACLAAVRADAPSAPLEGADLTGAASWLLAYANQESGHLAYLGQHLYIAGCVKDYAGQTALQADAKLLSPALVTRAVSNFKWVVADAKIARARPIMSETNSICSGGLAGVSNSYAAALWAIDYMLTGAENGVYGMNFHDRFTASCTPYSPLCPVPGQPGEFTAEPLYYGMLFAHLLGTGSLLPVAVRVPSTSDNVTAFALKPATGGLRLIVENLTGQHTSLTLSVGGRATSASVLHLTAPGLTATSGVRIQGAAVGASGTIKPGPPTVIKCSAGKCQLTLTPHTAVLVAIP